MKNDNSKAEEIVFWMRELFCICPDDSDCKSIYGIFKLVYTIKYDQNGSEVFKSFYFSKSTDCENTSLQVKVLQKLT